MGPGKGDWPRPSPYTIPRRVTVCVILDEILPFGGPLFEGYFHGPGSPVYPVQKGQEVRKQYARSGDKSPQYGIGLGVADGVSQQASGS